jgi:hypothetical protein
MTCITFNKTFSFVAGASEYLPLYLGINIPSNTSRIECISAITHSGDYLTPALANTQGFRLAIYSGIKGPDVWTPALYYSPGPITTIITLPYAPIFLYQLIPDAGSQPGGPITATVLTKTKSIPIQCNGNALIVLDNPAYAPGTYVLDSSYNYEFTLVGYQ